MAASVHGALCRQIAGSKAREVEKAWICPMEPGQLQGSETIHGSCYTPAEQ